MVTEEVKLGAALLVDLTLDGVEAEPPTWNLRISIGIPKDADDGLIPAELLATKFFPDGPKAIDDALSCLKGALGFEVARSEAILIEETINNLRADYLREKAFTPA